MSEKIWLKGNAKEKKFDNGGSVINVSLNVAQLQEHMNEKGWVNIVIGSKRQTDQYGNTHGIFLNDFTPDPNWQSSAGRPAAEAPSDDDSAPF